LENPKYSAKFSIITLLALRRSRLYFTSWIEFD